MEKISEGGEGKPGPGDWRKLSRLGREQKRD